MMRHDETQTFGNLVLFISKQNNKFLNRTMNGHVNYFQDMPNVPQNVNSKKHSPHVILKQRMAQKKEECESLLN